MHLPTSFATVTPLFKFLALFLFILFPLVGFKLGMEYQMMVSQTEEQIANPPTKVISPTTSPIQTDDMANWKTHRREEYGFEFQYPEYFELRTSEQNYGNDMYLHVSITDTQYEPKTPLSPSFIYITKPVKLEKQSFEEYIDTNYPPGETIHGQEVQSISSREEIFIDNRYKSYKVTSCSILCSESIFLNSGDKVVVISTLGFSELDDNYIKNTILKILSTFRFLEENQSPQQFCRQYQGRWLEEFGECVNIQNNTPEPVCSRAGGVFNECSSPCRHDPNWPNVRCVESCDTICGFSFFRNGFR